MAHNSPRHSPGNVQTGRYTFKCPILKDYHFASDRVFFGIFQEITTGQRLERASPNRFMSEEQCLVLGKCCKLSQRRTICGFAKRCKAVLMKTILTASRIFFPTRIDSYELAAGINSRFSCLLSGRFERARNENGRQIIFEKPSLRIKNSITQTSHAA